MGLLAGSVRNAAGDPGTQRLFEQKLPLIIPGLPPAGPT
jgi:hypothetical protein